jgi:hypothetical protein
MGFFVRTGVIDYIDNDSTVFKGPWNGLPPTGSSVPSGIRGFLTPMDTLRDKTCLRAMEQETCLGKYGNKNEPPVLYLTLIINLFII